MVSVKRPLDFRSIRVLVVGDCILDRYVQGPVSRISPEAPVPVVAVAAHHERLGGAANVAAGLAALGAQAWVAGVIGDDSAGVILRDRLAHAGIAADLLVNAPETNTICKTRIVAEHYHQQLLRLDEDGPSGSREAAAIDNLEAILAQIGDYDAVILADYEKGSLPAGVLRAILQACRNRRIPTVVDPKKRDFALYSGATLLTPNLAELERAAGHSLPSQGDIAIAGQRLRRDCNLSQILCTCAAEGMWLIRDGGEIHIPATVRDVADVTGAGDTVAAVVALGLAAGWPVEEACRLAAAAAGIAVSHPHTYAVQLDELEQCWLGRSPRIVSAENAQLQVLSFRRSGKRIVFSNGCFDVLHAGHLALLEAAKQLGDVLVLGLNSDASVRRHKGATRPRLAQSHRAALLAGLACVDLVVVFEEDTPHNLLRQLQPDVLVKGGDYDPTEVVGAELVREYGGQVVVVPHVDGLSSTAILGTPPAAPSRSRSHECRV